MARRGHVGRVGGDRGQYLKKGTEVAIEGRLAYRTYEDSEGHTRYVTEVVAGEMLMLDRKPDSKAADRLGAI